MSDSDTDDKTKSKDGDEQRDSVAPSLKKRKPMDIVMQVAAALAAICAFVIGYISLTGWKSKESYGLWVSYVGIVLVLLAVAAYIQKQIWENDAALAAQNTSPASEKSTPEQKSASTVSAADRPWLSVSIAPNGPLTFSGKDVTLRTRFIVRNTGRSAANGATINAQVIAPKLGGNVYKEAIDRQKDICLAGKPDIRPRTVFPGDGYAMDVTFSIGRQEVEKNGIEGTNIIGLFIIGCVNYRFGTQPTIYQTGFVREVRVVKPETPEARYGLSMDEDVPADRLIFEVGILGGDYAN